MTVYVVVLLSMLNSIGQRGSKVAVSLYALELGAGALSVGVLAALFSVFPLLLAVQAGRLSDRFGVRMPIVLGALVMAAGLVIPLATSGIAWLFLCSSLIGLGHIFFHVSIHNLVGSLGGNGDVVRARTRNFATFALGSSLAAFFGPSLAGFAIDLAGFRPAFAALAISAALPAAVVLLHRGLIPAHVTHEDEEQAKNAFDLLAIPALRRTLIMSGVTLTGIELFSFYLPIYGRSIGLSASVIGMVLSTYAVAGFIVRSFMHRLALGSAQPLTIILTYNHAPAGRSGEALGMRIMANKVTQIAVPLAFGGFGAAMGAVPVFLATGVFLLAAGLISLKGGNG